MNKLNLDIYICLSAIFDFGLFLILHALIFHYVSLLRVMSWLKKICLGVTILIPFQAFGLYQSVPAFSYFSIIIFSEYILFTFLLFMLLTFIYTLGIFGVVISSIRIQLLEEIGQTKTQGISYTLLRNKHSVLNLIRKRLQRLTCSNEVVLSDGYYHLSHKHSYLKLHLYIQNKLYQWFANKK